MKLSLTGGEVIFDTWNLAFPGTEQFLIHETFPSKGEEVIFRLFSTWNLAFPGGRSNFWYMKLRLPGEATFSTRNLAFQGGRSNF